MTDLHLFDSASPWDEARLEQVKKHGGIAVSVYVRGTPGGFRHASKADVALAHSMGLGVVPNWESLADWFRTATVAQAKAAGAEALQACRDLGLPDDGSVSVPFSFDYQMTEAAYPGEAGRLAAAQEGLTDAYRATAYGQSGFVQYLHRHGFGDRGHWLMASTWGLPYDIGQPGVAVVQSHHADGTWFASPIAGTDANTITQPGTLGAWWPDNSPYGGSMALSDDDKAWIKANTANATEVENLLAEALVAALTGQDSGQFTAAAHPALLKAAQADNAQATALAAAVAKIQTGAVDPVALAKALAAHVGLVAK